MRARAASLVSLALLCSCSAFSWEHDADHLIESALNITRGHGGECAIGVGCGVVAGWLFRKLQGAIVTAAVVGALGTGLALHQNWVTPDGVHAGARVAVRALQETASAHAGSLDMDGDGSLTLEDSKLMGSKVAPFVQRHPGFAGGVVGGLAFAQRLL
mmetsp:Transcript_32625/g.102437  ORF Transcript_32625/g.102437 Transcript_32625/m.102437 type:complete len:158 (+) Transcript_32625:39-512(+)